MDMRELLVIPDYSTSDQNDYTDYLPAHDLEGIPHLIYAEQGVVTPTENVEDQNSSFRFPADVEEEVVGPMEMEILGDIDFEGQEVHFQLNEVHSLYNSHVKEVEEEEEEPEPELIDLEEDLEDLEEEDASNCNLNPAPSKTSSRDQENVTKGHAQSCVLHDHNFAKTDHRSTSRSNPTQGQSYPTVEVPSAISVNLNSDGEDTFQFEVVNSSGNFVQNFNLDLTQLGVRNGNPEYHQIIPFGNGLQILPESQGLLSEISSTPFTLSTLSSLIDTSASSATTVSTSVPSKESQAKQRRLVPKSRPVLSSSVLNISVPGGYSVQMQRYIYTQPICRVCLLAKSDMVYLFEDMDISDRGLIKNAKGPSNPSNRYNLLAAMKTLLDIDVIYGDSLPDHICIECMDNLMSFSAFRLQVAVGQGKLNSVIEQVKNTSTPTVIPPLGELNIKGIDIFRHADSIIRVREMFKTSPYVHNVLRYIPDRVLEKIFTIFANAVGFKSQKLNSLKAYALDPPYARGWLCHACGQTIRGSTADYAEHFLNIHDVKAEDVYFPCDICGEMFLIVDNTGISENYAEHWIHHFFFHKCDSCDKFLPSQKGLWVHNQSAHPVTTRLLTCRKCLKHFHKRSHLMAHLRTHLDPEQRKPFLNWCKICGKGLSSSLKAHMDSIHNESRLWKCEICSKQFKRKVALMHHRDSVHLTPVQFQCEICNQILGSEHALADHLTRCKTSTLSHSCQICQKRFTTASGLRTHADLSHPPPVSDAIEGDGVTSSSISTCVHCTKKFKRKEYLIEHMKVHSGETPYKCPYEDCKKEIRMRSNYLKHLRVHQKRDAECINLTDPVLIVLDDNSSE